MSSFFESELRKLFEDGKLIQSPKFIGRECFGMLGGELRLRAQFIHTCVSGNYDALKLTILNRTEGAVDAMALDFLDIWGRKPVPNNPNFPNGVAPHIWEHDGKCEWYAYKPNTADYRKLSEAAKSYLDTFRASERGGPKLVYICAPLRRDVEKNVEFARRKAQEVFAEGDIPICPHLMFPPVADLGDPVQDQKARDMCLRLIESCQQLNVYGSEWTDGMWTEIHHASKLGIEMRTDQQTIPRSRGRRREVTK